MLAAWLLLFITVVAPMGLPMAERYEQQGVDETARLLEQLMSPGGLNEFGRVRGGQDVYEQRPPVLPGFPVLTAAQKQFAVHPGLPEYYEANPDFLKFRLEQLEESLNTPQALSSRSADVKRASLKENYMSFYLPDEDRINNVYFTVIVACATAVAAFGVIAAGFCYHRVNRQSKESEEAEYPAYGVTGPAKDSSPSGDKRLAQSAQMYHYQHQKNQMIALGRANGNGTGHQSDNESDDGEAEEGDYTVYECPGLASTDEMEVKNPLFNDDPTPKNP